MPRDTLAPYPWPCSVSWCLSEGYRNGDQCRASGLMWLVMATLLTYLLQQNQNMVSMSFSESHHRCIHKRGLRVCGYCHCCCIVSFHLSALCVVCCDDFRFKHFVERLEEKIRINDTSSDEDSEYQSGRWAAAADVVVVHLYQQYCYLSLNADNGRP